MGRVLVDLGTVGERIQHADQHRAPAHHGDLVDHVGGGTVGGGQRPAHLEHDIGVAVDRLGVRDDRRAGLGEGVVGYQRAGAGARLDDHLDTPVGELPDHIGRAGDARLAGAPFPGDANLHA